MRVTVYGTGNSSKALRSLIARDKVLVLSDTFGQFTVKLEEDPTQGCPVIDGVDSEFERLVVSHLARACGAVLVAVDTSKPATSDVITITFPPHEALAVRVEQSVYRALLDVARPTEPPVPHAMYEPPPVPWWQFWGRR